MTLRKFSVFVVFATQEVSRVATSALATTIVSQCKTKVYLADESAKTDIVATYYQKMGLTPSEINTVANGRMKRDYFYKSTEGVRQFQLELDDFQLALLAPGVEVLDSIEKQFGRNSMKPLAVEILQAKGFGKEVKKYMS